MIQHGLGIGVLSPPWKMDPGSSFHFLGGWGGARIHIKKHSSYCSAVDTRTFEKFGEAMPTFAVCDTLRYSLFHSVLCQVQIPLVVCSVDFMT